MKTSLYYLENDIGERKALNIGGDVFLKNVEGLGVTATQNNADLKDGFFSNVNTDIPQDSIVGNLVFLTKAFENYKSLVDWILSSNELFFVYNPLGEREYYRRVVLNYITKQRRYTSGYMTAAISLSCLTPWYLPTPLNVSFAKQTETAFRYPYTYNSNLRYGTSNIGSYAAEISKKGHLPGSISLSYIGSAVNPKLTLAGIESGKIYGRCKISLTFSETDALKISTSPRNGYVQKVESDGTVTDLIDTGAVDITSDPFVRMPTTENCYLQLSADEALSGDAEVQVFYYYRSV